MPSISSGVPMPAELNIGDDAVPFNSVEDTWDMLPEILNKLTYVAYRMNRHAKNIPGSPASDSRCFTPSRRTTQDSSKFNLSPSQPEEMKLSEFCKLVQQPNSIYADARLLSLTCYKDLQGIPHEFLVAHIRIPNEPDMWIRLERAADLSQPISWLSRMYPVSSTFKADDKAKIALDETDLLSPGGITPMEKLMFKADKISLKSFAVLLEVFANEASTYSLRKKNCWFFCSVIMENLAQTSFNQVRVRYPSLGKDIRKRIRARYLQEGFRPL